jgi:hypothetical protein
MHVGDLNVCDILFTKPERKRPHGDLGEGKKIILKWISQI